MYYISLERSSYSASAGCCSIKIHEEMAKKSQVKYRMFYIHLFPCIHDGLFPHSLLEYGHFYLINYTKWWIIKVKHPSVDIHTKIYISLMKIYNMILVLHPRIILLSPFVIYFFCIKLCHSESFPTVYWLCISLMLRHLW